MDSEIMEHSIYKKTGDHKGELLRKFNASVKYLLTGVIIACLIIEIYVICRILIQFIIMCENWIRLYILNYLIK